MNWIKNGTLLRGEIVELRPLSESNLVELELLAREVRIWEFTTADMSTFEKRMRVFERALFEKGNGTQYPFIIYHKEREKIIGSTRLMTIEPIHRKLEIGWTWLHPEYWGTAVNFECKLLLLTFCFEELDSIRVQLKADENNIRSRKAIQKIGAKFEGILRQDMIRENGTIRNTAFYSIIDTEWEPVRKNLIDKLQIKNSI